MARDKASKLNEKRKVELDFQIALSVSCMGHSGFCLPVPLKIHFLWSLTGSMNQLHFSRLG